MKTTLMVASALASIPLLLPPKVHADFGVQTILSTPEEKDAASTFLSAVAELAFAVLALENRDDDSFSIEYFGKFLNLIEDARKKYENLSERGPKVLYDINLLSELDRDFLLSYLSSTKMEVPLNDQAAFKITSVLLKMITDETQRIIASDELNRIEKVQYINRVVYAFYRYSLVSSIALGNK